MKNKKEAQTNIALTLPPTYFLLKTDDMEKEKENRGDAVDSLAC